MTELVEKAINSVNKGVTSFCKFITANDTGETGAHQEGFYIPKAAYSLFFDKQGLRGNNEENFVKIKWQDDFETDSRAIYYGQGTRNEYRLTRFGKGFPLLQEEYTGGLLIITKLEDSYYKAFILNDEDDIEYFLDNFGMSPVDTNALIATEETSLSITAEAIIEQFMKNLSNTFPETLRIANAAREIAGQLHKINPQRILTAPDRVLVDWIHTEYELFKKIETHYYTPQISQAFNSVGEFIDLANTILNRRKSRAGKSLEHHLDVIFTTYGLKFSHPGRREGYKKPDFIFPGNDQYPDVTFSRKTLVFLGAKTTCKDRWRQILNEADRINNKHLFTLQQGISKNQLKEMYDSNVILVIPEAYISSYPVEYQEKILS